MRKVWKQLAMLVSIIVVGILAGSIVVEANVSFTLPWRISNPDFEQVNFNGAANAGQSGVYYVNQDNVSGWSTTSPTQYIEVWQEPNASNIPAYSGQNFIELNAQDNYPIYQDIQTVPGTTLHWGFAHRGRNGVDKAGLLMGAPGNLSLITTVEDDNTAWTYYSGVYVVPPGQTLTQLTFLAISTSSGSITDGNFLDDVSLTLEVPGSQLGDYVWYDTDGDGLQQPYEPAAEGITVDLLNPNGNIVDSTITNQMGGYLFDDVAPGNYDIRVHLPVNGQYQYGFTKQFADGLTGFNSAADANGIIHDVRSTIRGYHVDYDAGIITYGDAYIEKIDGDYQIPVEGAVFDIADSFGQTVMQVTSDNQGLAKMQGLATGKYQVVEVATPDKYQLQTVPTEFIIGFEPDQPVAVVITNYLKRGQLEVVKVDSADNNRVLSGATFRVNDANGGLVGEVASGSDGRAVFSNLLPGDYSLQEIKSPAGYALNSQVYQVTIPENSKQAVTIIVGNSRIVLPETGSSGTGLLGLCFLAAGGIPSGVGIYRRKRR